MQPVSKFFSDIVKSVSSSGVQLIITMVSTPLMTRLYEPAAYTSFGVINMLATTIVGVGLLSLPNVYPIEKDPQRRIEPVEVIGGPQAGVSAPDHEQVAVRRLGESRMGRPGQVQPHRAGTRVGQRSRFTTHHALRQKRNKNKEKRTRVALRSRKRKGPA